MEWRAEDRSCEDDIYHKGSRFSLSSLSNNILLLLSDDDDDDDDDEYEDGYIEIALEPPTPALYADKEEKRAIKIDNYDDEKFEFCSLTTIDPVDHDYFPVFHDKSTLTFKTATSSAAGHQQGISPSINTTCTNTTSRYGRKRIPMEMDRLITLFLSTIIFTFKGLISSEAVDSSTSSSCQSQVPLVKIRFVKSVWSMLLANSSSNFKVTSENSNAIGLATSGNHYQKKWFSSRRRWWLLKKRGNLNATSNKVEAAGSCPKSFPITKDVSVSAAIAHCKRSLGQIN